MTFTFFCFTAPFWFLVLLFIFPSLFSSFFPHSFLSVSVFFCHFRCLFLSSFYFLLLLSPFSFLLLFSSSPIFLLLSSCSFLPAPFFLLLSSCSFLPSPSFLLLSSSLFFFSFLLPSIIV